MFKLNKKLEYGILALLYLEADSHHQGCVREIAETCMIPETLLSKVMQTLKNKGIVQAVHGNQGGYKLVRSLNDISLLELNGALVGPVQITECLEPGNNKCPAQSSCNIVSPMNLLNQKIIQLFQSTSLETLVSRKVAV